LRISWNREDLAWAAGFMEGEGTFYCNLQKGKKAWYKPQAAISIRAVQVEKEPLEKLAQIFPFGRIYGPYRSSGNKQEHYQFAIHSIEGGQAMIAALWPWLSQKRRAQAKKALLMSLETQNTQGTINKIMRMAACHPDKKHFAKDKCYLCYNKEYNRKRANNAV
jgi:hypothetical protein